MPNRYIRCQTLQADKCNSGHIDPVTEQRPYDYGVVWRCRKLRTWRHRLAHRHDVLWSTVVLHSTSRAHLPLGIAIRFAGAWLLRAGESSQPRTKLKAQPDSRKAHQPSWNSTSRAHVPRGTGQPHNEQDVGVNEEDGVDHGMYGRRGAKRVTRRPRRRQHPCEFSALHKREVPDDDAGHRERVEARHVAALVSMVRPREWTLQQSLQGKVMVPWGWQLFNRRHDFGRCQPCDDM